jgi:hypothetical protein
MGGRDERKDVAGQLTELRILALSDQPKVDRVAFGLGVPERAHNGVIHSKHRDEGGALHHADRGSGQKRSTSQRKLHLPERDNERLKGSYKEDDWCGGEASKIQNGC